jgi:RHS repeat-associated protein
MEDSFQPAGCGVVAEERGFTGHADDYETDLVYMQQRYYDPTAGRFLSIDPVGPIVGDPRTINRYAYAWNSPYRYNDPTGEVPLDTIFDAASLVYDIGKISVGYATGNPQLVSDGLVDLASDTAALFIPYVPAGSTKVARALREGDVPKSTVHKNSRDYVGETHVYAVRNPDDTINKIGESAQGTRVRDGASKRAEQQVRKLNREVGPGHNSDIRKSFLNKDAARTYETKLIERYRSMYGQSTLPGNKTNR